VNAQYKALNFQVTSAEAVLTKRWLVRVFDELQQKFCYGWDGDCVLTLWVHDEICSKADIETQSRDVRFVPKADIADRLGKLPEFLRKP